MLTPPAFPAAPAAAYSPPSSSALTTPAGAAHWGHSTAPPAIAGRSGGARLSIPGLVAIVAGVLAASFALPSVIYSFSDFGGSGAKAALILLLLPILGVLAYATAAGYGEFQRSSDTPDRRDSDITLYGIATGVAAFGTVFTAFQVLAAIGR